MPKRELFVTRLNRMADVFGKRSDFDINNHDYTDGFYRFRFERVYFFLPSALGDTWRETQILRVYVNHTMLTPTRGAYFVGRE